jgi:hypothetical protein
MTTELDTIDIPQADLIWDVARVPEAVARGMTTKTTIADYLGNKVPRQGLYYAQAAQTLGWVTRDEQTGQVALTTEGRVFLNADAQTKQQTLRTLMMTIEPMRSIITRLRQSNGLSREAIATIIQEGAALSDSTALRRAQTMSCWLKALGLATVQQGLLVAVENT